MRIVSTALLLLLSLSPAFWGCNSKPAYAEMKEKGGPPAGVPATAPPDYLEKVSPQNAMLIMVDYMTGFNAGLQTIDQKRYQNNVTALAKIGRIFKLPTIVLGDEGGFRGKFYPQINQYLPDAQKIGRHTPSAWDEPAFVAAVQKTGRKKLIVGGISLDNCTLLLALDALRAGYQVHVVVDASGTDDKLVEQAAMMRLTQAGAVMTSWVSLASELMGDWNTPAGPLVGKLYQDHSAWGE